VIIEGSSKDIEIEVQPTEDKSGIGYFIPKDTFSIFDYKNYGEWPFKIPMKGLAMTFIINKSFELAKKHGIDTCYIEGLKDRSKVKIVRVPGRELPLEEDKIPIGSKNRMVDLEIIFNLYLHPRSSLLKTFMNNKKDYRDYGFDEMPEPLDKIPRLKLSYTTKYDKRGDLHLSDEEARNRSRLTNDQWKESIELIEKCIKIIDEYANTKKLIRIDGKHEILVDDQGKIAIADTFGNPEEDRYIFEIKDFALIERFFYFYATRWSLDQTKINNIIKEVNKQEHYYQDFSKQFLRNWYIDNGWKKQFDEDKSIKPPMMPRDIISAYSNAMLTFAAIWSGRTNEVVDLSGDLVRPMDEVAAELFVLEELNRHNMIKAY
jgi:phosphoribosylaminoimidazole-succinocarboxamide synthase